MIVGSVRNLEPQVELRIRGDGRSIEATAVVDTGFTGELTLPIALVNDLDLEYEAEVEAVLADGTVVRTDAYSGTVEWSGVDRKVTVIAGEGDVLIGMMLMNGHDLNIEIVEGGSVRIVERR